MGDTMARREVVDVVKPYYYAAGYNIMVPKSMNLNSWAELKGKPVCAIESAYYNYEAAIDAGFHLMEFAGPGEALAAMKQGRCVGVLYDDAAIKGDLLDSQWSDYEMPLESQDVQPWGLAVRKNQPEWVAYLSTMVSRWAKDGTILDLETKYQIRHSRFAEDAHRTASKP